VLVELMVDRPDSARIVGDIYLGKVEAVLPGIQAAFVDIGTEKAAFLHVSDVAAEDDEPTRGRRRPGAGRPTRTATAGAAPRAAIPPSRTGEEGAGPAGAGLQGADQHQGAAGHRAHLAPGRFLVYMPGSDHVGVSRKIEDREERARLRALAREILPERAGGVIVRTVGEELTRETFERELKSLLGTWKQIQKRRPRPRPRGDPPRGQADQGDRPRPLLAEGRLAHRRQLPGPRRGRQYLEQVDPSLVERVHLYEDAEAPLRRLRDREREIHEAFQRG
jgi:ribonuclease G